MTVINTNVGALMARTYATKANDKMQTSMERLSSGMRINSAADDAAGLAVANKMTSQLSGIKMAIRNSQDGISLVQTAEAGMGEITNMILRMRELAVQMENGIYTAKDRDNAQLEVNALLSEIDKIAVNTRFNDVAVLDGSYDQTIRAGTDGLVIRSVKHRNIVEAGVNSNLVNLREKCVNLKLCIVTVFSSINTVLHLHCKFTHPQNHVCDLTHTSFCCLNKGDTILRVSDCHLDTAQLACHFIRHSQTSSIISRAVNAHT